MPDSPVFSITYNSHDLVTMAEKVTINEILNKFVVDVTMPPARRWKAVLLCGAEVWRVFEVQYVRPLGRGLRPILQSTRFYPFNI